MTLRSRLNKHRLVAVISTYPPTRDAEEDIKDQLYSQLDQVLTAVPREDKLILLGDFSARESRDSRLWNNIIGKEGVGKANSNGILLLSKLAEHDLVITNTLFLQRSMYKTTRMHPRSKHWHLLDYVIVLACDQKGSALHEQCAVQVHFQQIIAWSDHEHSPCFRVS